MTDKGPPYLNIDGYYYSKSLIDQIWSTLQAKALIWASGLEQPSPIERFAYDVLYDRYAHEEFTIKDLGPMTSEQVAACIEYGNPK